MHLWIAFQSLSCLSQANFQLSAFGCLALSHSFFETILSSLFMFPFAFTPTLSPVPPYQKFARQLFVQCQHLLYQPLLHDLNNSPSLPLLCSPQLLLSKYSLSIQYSSNAANLIKDCNPNKKVNGHCNHHLITGFKVL